MDTSQFDNRIISGGTNVRTKFQKRFKRIPHSTDGCLGICVQEPQCGAIFVAYDNVTGQFDWCVLFKFGSLSDVMVYSLDESTTDLEIWNASAHMSQPYSGSLIFLGIRTPSINAQCRSMPIKSLCAGCAVITQGLVERQYTWRDLKNIFFIWWTYKVHYSLALIPMSINSDQCHWS